MNYSLLNMMTNEMVPIECKGRLRVTLAPAPLLSLQSADMFHVFPIFLLPFVVLLNGYRYS
jgi:hypothetical protein